MQRVEAAHSPRGRARFGPPGLASPPLAAGFGMVLSLIFVLCFVSCAQAQDATDDANGTELTLQPTEEEFYVSVRTDSPRRTFISFIRLREQLELALLGFEQQKSPEAQARVVALLEELAALIDLSGLPRATVRENSIDTVGYLLDIFGRVQLPAMQDIALSEGDDGDEVLIYRIPGTPLTIQLVQDGDRAGEYLFSARTVRAAPRFFTAIQGRQLKTGLEIAS